MRLSMYRGDSAVFNLECKQADGSPLDISTGTLTFTVKNHSRQTDLAAVCQKTNGSGISVTNGPAGLATVTLAPTDTSGQYAPAFLIWDLQYETAGGAITTLIAGELVLRADATRST